MTQQATRQPQRSSAISLCPPPPKWAPPSNVDPSLGWLCIIMPQQPPPAFPGIHRSCLLHAVVSPRSVAANLHHDQHHEGEIAAVSKRKTQELCGPLLLPPGDLAVGYAAVQQCRHPWCSSHRRMQARGWGIAHAPDHGAARPSSRFLRKCARHVLPSCVQKLRLWGHKIMTATSATRRCPLVPNLFVIQRRVERCSHALYSKRGPP